MSNTWLKSAIFYEIYPNSFMDGNGDGYGDLVGITSKLDHIKSLGANAIWLNPHYDSPFRDGGYDVRDYFKTSSRFGSEEDFDTFVKSAHAKGIKVVLDLVAGHVSEENADFLKSAENTPNELYDRFIWTNDVWGVPDGFRFVCGRFDRRGSYIVNFFSTQPALNYGFNRIDDPSWQMPYTSEAAQKTREWLKSVIRFWLDRGCDGFRVDMADSLVKNDDENKTATTEIWRDIRAMMERDYPDTVLISEWSSPLAVRAGFDADFMLDHKNNPYNLLVRAEAHGGHSYFDADGRGDAKAFADGFTEWYEKTKDFGQIGLVTCNHDTPRLAPAYTQEQLKLIYATLFCLPGVPFIYYGDEIGMKYIPDLPSVEGGFSRTGTRTPMQWSFDANAGFSTAEHTFLPVARDKTVNVAAQQKDKKSLLNFFKEFIAFRKSRREFTERDFEIEYASGGAPLCFSRGKLVCIVNPAKTRQSASVKLSPKSKALFTVGKGVKIKKDSVDVPPLSFNVIEKN